MPAHAALFAIAQPTFSGYAVCRDGVYEVADPAVGDRIPRKKLRQGRLHFSLRIIGQERAIEHLKKFGALEVTIVFWSGITKLGERSVGISQDNWDRNGAALTQEQNATGIFNWRTCGFTQNISDYSSIQVKIRDENLDFASPVDIGGSYEANVVIDP
jgi:hypothetical protein